MFCLQTGPSQYGTGLTSRPFIVRIMCSGHVSEMNVQLEIRLAQHTKSLPYYGYCSRILSSLDKAQECDIQSVRNLLGGPVWFWNARGSTEASRAVLVYVPTLAVDSVTTGAQIVAFTNGTP